MAADSSYLPTDAQLLYDYLGRMIERGAAQQPAAELIAELSDYSNQLEKLRHMVSEAEESLARGEGRPIDLDALMQRVRRRLAKPS